MKLLAITLVAISLSACAYHPQPQPASQGDNLAALEYLRSLEGEWVVQGGNEGPIGWKFDVTSRGTTVVERLKVDTDTEMTTIYHLENDALVASHYCQLKNKPRLIAVNSSEADDLHFECDGHVGNAESHADLHMHGVHFRKQDEQLIIWMDMVKNGEVAFTTSYTLRRRG